MKIAMMAAGVGSRLDPNPDNPPKVLLRFQGKSLLQRHLEILRAQGFDDLTIVVGHQADSIRSELRELGAEHWVETCFNPDYRDSSLLSLWCLREVFAVGDSVIYMDADVLYDHRLMARLVQSSKPSSLLIDRQSRLDDEALKVCIRNGAIADFHKQISATSYDEIAEWVGFARFSATAARQLVQATRRYVEAGNIDLIYEEPIRDVILNAPSGEFGCEDIIGLPWIEIDFPEDLHRATDEILPKLQDSPHAATRPD